ncbi:MAG: DNA polymerase IV [Patescibacteria group bacterium]
MNSYFASVEQQANPKLRGRPLGVCAYLHNSGCVIAASIEAKQLGMKVGMRVRDARAICPQAVFVQNDPPKYRAVTSRVFSILHELTDRIEHYSIDEAFLDLTGWYRDAAEAAWAMSRVRQRITNEVGEWLRCSIGIAPTRFLAKTGSNFRKPNGLTIIDTNNLDEILSQLNLQDLNGIGPQTHKRLERAGIHSPLELKNYPVANLIRLFGKQGFYLWCKLHAMEFEKVQLKEELPPKSIGHSYCVPDCANDEGKIAAILTRLTERAGRRMRKEGLFAGTVSVNAGFRNMSLRGANEVSDAATSFSNPYEQGAYNFVHLDEPSQDSFTLVHAACDLLSGIWKKERVSFLAVTLSNFSKLNNQSSFALAEKTAPASRKQKSVSDSLDLIRDRYGDESIIFGSMFGLGDEAPDRIGFRKTTGVEIGLE